MNSLLSYLFGSTPTVVSDTNKLPVEDYVRPGDARGEAYDHKATIPVCDSTYISSATTTTCVTGAGVLHSIVVGETAAGAITVYDNTAGSGTIKAVLKASIVEGTYLFDLQVTTGLTIVTAAASKITVNWLAVAP